jgi:ADP-ribose pyrophosphatase
MKETTIIQEAYLHIKRIEGVLPNGVKISRILVRHTGAAVIIPITDTGDYMLIEQYRLPVNQYLTEFPAGGIEAGEDLITTAQRELREETGYAAKEIIPIGHIYPAVGFCDEIQHLFIAKDLYPAPLAADADEEFKIRTFSRSDLEKLIAKGGVPDAKTVASFLRAELYRKEHGF